MLVRTADLTKRYGDLLAVDHVTLGVRGGEVAGLAGPRGAGKTTLLRMLLGLTRPTYGTAVVAGRPPGHPDGLARIGALVGEPAFYPYLSGRDNLRVVARYAHVPHSQADAALAAVGLTGHARVRYAGYPPAARRLLGVAAALLKDPDLLVLDDPWHDLDAEAGRDLSALLRELASGGRAVLVTGGDEVAETCDRLTWLAHGRATDEAATGIAGSVGTTGVAGGAGVGGGAGAAGVAEAAGRAGGAGYGR